MGRRSPLLVTPTGTSVTGDRARSAGTRRDRRSRAAGPGHAAILLAAPQRVPMDGHGKAFAYFALFTEIGLVLFVTTLGGALAGRWIDQQLGSNPILVILGFLSGALLGAVVDWRLISRFLRQLND